MKFDEQSCSPEDELSSSIFGVSTGKVLMQPKWAALFLLPLLNFGLSHLITFMFNIPH